MTEQIVLLEYHRRFLPELMNFLFAGMPAVHLEIPDGNLSVTWLLQVIHAAQQGCFA
ncbi:hypothetical protein D3C81_1936860 [compost metagenome]